MAIRPGPPFQWQTNAAELRLRPARRRLRRLVVTLLAVIGLCGLAVSGLVVRGQLRPRAFTAAQQKRIQAWEVAKRWRTTPKVKIFPSVIKYTLTDMSKPVGAKGGSIALSATRLAIARQASCARAAGSRKLMTVLAGQGCQALLRSTYADATGSLVLTAGIAVLQGKASAMTAATYLTGGPGLRPGGPSRLLVLRPFHVNGTPAALYGYPQRQLSWVVAAGPYLVMTTVGYADGRPRVHVTGDSYAAQEMTTLARGVATKIAAPLGTPPPLPRCPGAPGC